MREREVCVCDARQRQAETYHCSGRREEAGRRGTCAKGAQRERTDGALGLASGTVEVRGSAQLVVGCNVCLALYLAGDWELASCGRSRRWVIG